MEEITTAKSKGMSVHARRALSYVVLVIVSIMCLFWFYVLFINATRSNDELGRGFTMIPSKYAWVNFSNLLHGTQPIFSGLRNSVVISGANAIIVTYFATMSAFAVHAYTFKGKKAIFTAILAIMMIPTQVTALGFIQLLRHMNLMDSFIPLIIPSIASPVTLFYMKQYMESTLPFELLEAARIDGANEFLIFNRIALPLMKPAIAVQAIFSFVGTWNNYFTPALVLSSNNKKTLPILIAALRSAEWLKFDMGQVYMMIAFSIFPVIVVYLILSQYIVAGLSVGAVKG